MMQVRKFHELPTTKQYYSNDLWNNAIRVFYLSTIYVIRLFYFPYHVSIRPVFIDGDMQTLFHGKDDVLSNIIGFVARNLCL